MADTNFFDFRESLSSRRSTAPPSPRSAGDKSRPLTVLQLTNLIDRAIRAGVPASVLVQGEVSNFNHHRESGHFYFTLKDAESCIDCVMFRSDAQRLKFTPEDGMEAIAGGRVSVYPARGRYQLYVSSLRPVGRGALEIAFQQLRAKLETAGLFAVERKQSIPAFPMRIALVTGRETAALQDMLKVVRRFPWIKLFLYHVPVQGDGSAEQIAAAIAHLDATRTRSSIDVILLARGGGSLEDLWEFNEEVVARAIAESRIPIITGIGHEVDVSIADLVADYHAHTPTEAAQIVTSHWKLARDQLTPTSARLRRDVLVLLQEARQRLVHIERHEVFRRPTDRINLHRQMLDDRQRSLGSVLGHRLRHEQVRIDRLTNRLLECHPRHVIDLARERWSSLRGQLRHSMADLHRQRVLQVDALGTHLEAVSPFRVLKRGYSMTVHKRRGKPVKSAKDLGVGDRIVTHFVDGSVESTVEDANQPSLFE